MKRNNSGFTIVELLIVIVVIAVLAAVSVVAYNGVQNRARQSKISSDLSLLQKAVMAGRINVSNNMRSFVTHGYVAGSCASHPAGTDLAALPRTDACWTTYGTALSQIETASGIKVTGMTDPWGRPYFIDANEGEPHFNAGCAKDNFGVFANPLNGANQTNSVYVPFWNPSCS